MPDPAIRPTPGTPPRGHPALRAPEPTLGSLRAPTPRPVVTCPATARPRPSPDQCPHLSAPPAPQPCGPRRRRLTTGGQGGRDPAPAAPPSGRRTEPGDARPRVQKAGARGPRIHAPCCSLPRVVSADLPSPDFYKRHPETQGPPRTPCPLHPGGWLGLERTHPPARGGRCLPEPESG